MTFWPISDIKYPCQNPKNPFKRNMDRKVKAMIFIKTIGGMEFTRAKKLATKTGILVGTIICLLVKILSASGTIIDRVTPSKIAEKNMQIPAKNSKPLCGFKKRNNLRYSLIWVCMLAYSLTFVENLL